MPKFIYYDVYSLQAVCINHKKEEVRFNLTPKAGKEKLCWEVAGQVIQSDIPKSHLEVVMKRPAAVMKKPGSARVEREACQEEEDEEEGEEGEEKEEGTEEEEGREGEEEENKEEDEEEENQEEDEEEDEIKDDQEEGADNGGEEEGEEEEEQEEEAERKDGEKLKIDGEASQERKSQKQEEKEKEEGDAKERRTRVTKKRPCAVMVDDDFIVSGIYVVTAHRGKHIRSYLLAKGTEKRKQLVQVTPSESRKYCQIIVKMKAEAEGKLDELKFEGLRKWASRRKEELLAGDALFYWINIRLD